MIRAYERDPKLKPLDAQMHFDYGVAFMELGSGLEMYAIEAFKAAARLRPSWPAGHSQLGLAYASANRREEAVESYRQAIKLKPEDTDTLAALAHASLLLGSFDESEQAALRMVEASPLDSGPHFVLGVAELLQGRYAEADESLRRAVSLKPDLAEACYGIGLYERLIELDRGLAEILIKHRRRGSFTPAEVVSRLFETTCDPVKTEGSSG